MTASEGKKTQVRLNDDLTPEQQTRLRSAVRLVVNHLLDNASLNRKNEITIPVERQKATILQAVQLRFEI